MLVKVTLAEMNRYSDSAVVRSNLSTMLRVQKRAEGLVLTV